MNFNKVPLTVQQQVAFLKSKGMVIENEVSACKYLSNISYYRLKAYFLAFRNYKNPALGYMPWASFPKAINLYNFDRELRFILLSAIERIEVAIRCRLAQEYSERFGTHWYEDDVHYNPAFVADTTTKGFKEWKRLYKGEIKRSKETFIDHYKTKYTHPPNPPSWMFIEVISFGQLSMLFKNLKKSDAKKAVSDSFGVKDAILESWLEHLAYIRNMCAHHSRLWNRVLTVKPILPTNTSFPWVNKTQLKSDKIFSTICIMAYMLERVENKGYFYGQIRALVEKYSDVNIKAAGFYKDWQRDIFWQSLYLSYTYRMRIVFFRRFNWAFKPSG